jgi:pyruvate/2-oxoglutarate dehydrogenase complex dihydrolipoamide acyltransferase (E2) component
VRAPARGHLSNVFFMAGERVKRGQLLAKLERPYGTPAYLIAPVAGRIGPALLTLDEYLAQHATVAVIETSAAH